MSTPISIDNLDPAQSLSGSEKFPVQQNGKTVYVLTKILAAYIASGGEGVREIELQKASGYIQWRYFGDPTWINLVALSEITGAKGDDGDDGKNIELQKTTTYIQWRVVGDPTWINLVALTDLKGDPGVGVPTGGTTGQVLRKSSNADYATEWADNIGVTDGDKTDIVVSSSGATWLIKASRILGQALTGLSAVSGTIGATDSIVLAFSKVLYFINNIAGTILATTLAGLNTSLTGAITSSDSVLSGFGKTQKQFNDLAEELKIEFLPTVLTANILYTKKITFSAVASSNINSATISYKVNGGTTRTALADVNTDIQATSGNYTLAITVALTSSTTSGLLSLTGKY